MITEATQLLVKAKEDYRRALAAVDVHLLAAVRADPKQAKAAQALQSSYTKGFDATPLTILIQPAAAPKPKATKRAKAKLKAVAKAIRRRK